MYCPSCDKSYGAIHSRCPECHSWLKVSPPSSSRKGKSTAIGTATGPDQVQGTVSTLNRNPEPNGWADPVSDPPSAPTAWGAAEDSGGWSTVQAASLVNEPATSPPAGEWGASTVAPETPRAGSNTGWTDEGDAYGWGGSQASAPSTPSSPTRGSGWVDNSDSSDGWSAGSATSASPSQPTSGGGGWLGGEQPSPAPASGNGWLGDSATPTVSSSPSGGGWLGGDGPDTPSSQGWLGDEAQAPSMTQMVDQALNVRADDDFVDDSWVDEEIRDNEFDELEVPEFIAPAPEVGSLFLKMLMVAVLVVLVGGGILFVGSGKPSPEEQAAAKIQKQLEFGRGVAKSGRADLAAGKAALAVPQLQNAVVALAEGKAPKSEILAAEVDLGRALMADKDYEEAIKHWKSLKESGDKKYAAEAAKELAACKRQLRSTANGMIKEAKQYAAKGEINSVKRLGRDSLELYQKYGGSKAQLGDANGVIGRGFFNGREYPAAKGYFKKAVALAPGAGYESLLSKTNAELQPTSYIPPMQTEQYSPPPAAAQPSSAPSFDIGSPGYRTNSSGWSGGGSRSQGSAATDSAPSSTQSSAPRMKEIPMYRSSQSQSSGTRKGSQGVLQTY